MLIRIIKDWAKKNDLLKQTPNSSGLWGDFEFTEDPVEDCDVLVILNRLKYEVKVKAKHVLIIQMEPPTPAHAWYKEGYPKADAIVSQFENVQHPNKIYTHGSLPWHLNRTYDQLTSEISNTELYQKKGISMITSNADWMEGHEFRLGLIRELQSQKVSFDLFGKGFRFIEDKWDAHFPYQYSIVIENSFYPHYWTEKLADAMLSYTVPIYIGAPNIYDYFPEKSIIQINKGSYNQVIDQIKKVVDNDHYFDRLHDLKEARHLILNKYQLFPSIVDLVKQFPQNSTIKSYNLNAIIAPWEGREPDLMRRLQYQYRKLMNKKPY